MNSNCNTVPVVEISTNVQVLNNLLHFINNDFLSFCYV